MSLSIAIAAIKEHHVKSEKRKVKDKDTTHPIENIYIIQSVYFGQIYNQIMFIIVKTFRLMYSFAFIRFHHLITNTTILLLLFSFLLK